MKNWVNNSFVLKFFAIKSLSYNIYSNNRKRDSKACIYVEIVFNPYYTTFPLKSKNYILWEPKRNEKTLTYEHVHGRSR